MGYALRWDHLFGVGLFFRRAPALSVHRITILQARETAPLPKKQVQATMSCFSGTTFYISHKTISCHCSTLPMLDSCSSFAMQMCFLGVGAAAFPKHFSEFQRDSHVPGPSYVPSVPKMWLRTHLAEVIFATVHAIELLKLHLMFEHDV